MSTTSDVHVMQDAQDDRSKLCLNYVTKEPNVIANISRKFYCCVLYIVFLKNKIKINKT